MDQPGKRVEITVYRPEDCARPPGWAGQVIDALVGGAQAQQEAGAAGAAGLGLAGRAGQLVDARAGPDLDDNPSLVPGDGQAIRVEVVRRGDRRLDYRRRRLLHGMDELRHQQAERERPPPPPGNLDAMI